MDGSDDDHRPLFGPGATRVARWLLVVAVAAVAGVPAAAMLWVRSPIASGAGDPVVQPIPFDHRHHVQDAGLACDFCHREAVHAAHAGMPSPELCMRCHNQVLPDAGSLEPLRRAHARGESIPWKRVNDVPDFVFFHHGVHVAAGIDCFRCHGAIEDMPTVRQARPLSMGWCLDCHRHPEPAIAGEGPIHCSACHR